MSEHALAGLSVLVVTKMVFDDPREGGTLRVAAIVDRLRAEGARVSAVAVRGPDGGAVDRPKPRTPRRLRRTARVALSAVAVGSASVARWLSPGAVGAIGEVLDRDAPDVVLIEYSQLLIYAPLFRGIPIVCDLHNIEYELLVNYASSASGIRRLIARYEAGRVRRLERRVLRIAQAATTVSGHDTDMLIALTGGAPDRVHTAPNGVSDRAFAIEKRRTEGLEVVFIANLGWQPNVDAVDWLTGQVWPLVRAQVPTARLRLIGRGPRPQTVELDGREGISVHPDVPETWPYLTTATIATAPLLAAGGTRLKILEALATGTPVVATSLGALGLESVARQGVLSIVDSPAAFADALVAAGPDSVDPGIIRAAAERFRWAATLSPLVGALRESARH